MLQIVICEDNDNILRHIVRIINKVILDNSMECKIALAASTCEEAEAYVEHHLSPDTVFFLDIHLKNSKINGYDLARKIRSREKEQKQRKSTIVFISDYYYQYVTMGYSVQASDCIRKPISEAVLKDCLLNIYDDYLVSGSPDPEDSGNDTAFVSIKTGSEFFRIKINDIVYIDRNKVKRKSIIHTTAQYIECNESMDMLEKKLEGSCIMRCGKSFFINKNRIVKMDEAKKTIILDSGTGHTYTECFYGSNYKQSILEVFHHVKYKLGYH